MFSIVRIDVRIYGLTALILGLALATVVLIRPTGAEAVVRQVELEELVDQAQVIVVGRIEGIRSFWNQDRSLILTEAVVYVERRLKGAGPKEIRVRTVGGKIPEENVGLWVPDEARFQPGETVVLFLADTDKDHYLVAGRFQGKYELTQEADGQWSVRGQQGATQTLTGFVSRLDELLKK